MIRSLTRSIVTLWLALLCIATPAGAQIGQVAVTTIDSQFDIMIADAKATMLIDPARTIVKARASEQFAAGMRGRGRIIAIATAQWLQGEAYLRLNDVEHAAPLVQRAMTTVSHAGPPTKLNGDLLLSMGGIHTSKTNVAAALSDYQKAHNIFRDIGDTRSRAIALVSIALLYQEAQDYQSALKYYDQALDVYRADPQLLYVIYNNRGNALKDIGKIADAEAQYRLALGIARTLKSKTQEARVLRNIARGQLETRQLAAAETTIEQGLAASHGGDAASTRKEFWLLSAKAASLRGRDAQAEQLVGRTFDGIDLATTTLDMREGHQTAFEVYRKSGNKPLALAHLEAIKRLDDQTSKLAASANTSLASARFDFANQELRIAKLKADELQRNIDYERAQAKTRQTVTIGISGVVVVVVGMLAFGIVTLRRSRNRVRDANIDLAATNDKLGKALAAKTEFLATTSHEIRTPLNGILGMTQVMLADDAMPAKLRDRIGVVHGAGITMRALVDDILDVAKMETGNLTIERVAMDLPALLGEVTRMWEEQAKARGIAFVRDLGDTPTWIESDPARLRQIIFNLLSNALKFTEHGSVTLRAGAAGGRLSIAVTDSGIGIPADKQELIFESFRQVDAGTTRKFGGTGLGLAICRSLARAMDGDVRVESVARQGATFILELPLIPAAPPAAIVCAETQPALLIVDRSPITRSMLRAVLEPRAGAVICAGSVEEAVAKLRIGPVAQVLIDDATIRAMPDRDAALGTIAAAAAEAGAPTSLLWAAPDASDHAALLATGIDQIIAKPIAGVALSEKLYVSRNSRDARLVSRAA